ncbi:MAG: preprotein translocase subunit SecG [Pyrinomonadaceae bacterium]|nr:preprotein translocase subunit SecG [Pyrinomonadaceae bacterium]
MLYVLYAIFFVACIVLVASVLLQPGKTDAGALFTSNISSTAFGPRGTASVLSKMTIVAASVFMVTAFLISMPALQGGVSVLQTVGETPVETTAPATTEANTNAAPTENVSANAAPANAAQPAANSNGN